MKIRSLITLTLIATVLFVTAGFEACPKSEKDRNVAIARTVVPSLRAATPFINRLPSSPFNDQLKQKWPTVIVRAEGLVDAVDASNNTEIVVILADVMPEFTNAVTAFTNNELALAALALADIALHIFADRLGAEASTVKSAGGRTIVAEEVTLSAAQLEAIMKFRAQPSFGCKYEPKACR